MSLSRRELLKTSIGTCLALSQIKAKVFASALSSKGLKALYKDNFLLGTMLKPEAYLRETPEFTKLVNTEFNAIVADNAFKWMNIHPTDEHWDWSYADEFVKFGERNNMYNVGHVLVWHSQNPIGLFQGEGSDLKSGDVMLAKLEEHITTIVTRYKGRINAWDVVNEALDGNGWVNNEWYRTIGEDYVAKAFFAAHQADPEAVLLYNDYNLSSPSRRDVLVDYLSKAKNSGVPIHAVGMQGHFSLDFPNLDDFEESIEAFAEQGVRVHISELDVDVLPGLGPDQFPDYAAELDPYRDGLSSELEAKLAQRYSEIFKVLIKHQDKIDRVNLWGTTDGESWKNDFPIEGRVNYPLLFDRKLEPKAAYRAVAELKSTAI